MISAQKASLGMSPEITRESVEDPDAKISILHVCETARGGVGSYLNMFAAPEACQLTSACVVPLEHLSDIDQRLQVLTFSRRTRGVRAIVNMVVTLFRTKRQLRPDVIFCHSSFTLLALLALRLSGDRTPSIFCAHGWAVSRYEAKSPRARVVQFLEGTLCGLADVVVNISSADLELARRLRYRGRHDLVENAVEEPSKSAQSELFDRERLNLLFVGRLDHQKGLDILLASYKAAARQRDDLVLHIVGASVNGDGQSMETADTTVEHGWVSRADIDSYYRSADALVVPSRWEGFGLVVPEALRNGTPALVSTAGALPSLVSEGETGHVFELTPDDLSNLLVGLNAEALRAMEPVCKQAFRKRFTIERYMREFRALLETLSLPKLAGSLGDQPLVGPSGFEHGKSSDNA